MLSRIFCSYVVCLKLTCFALFGRYWKWYLDLWDKYVLYTSRIHQFVVVVGVFNI